MRIFWVLPLLLLSAAAPAASFDCSKASTSIEKLICTDQELSGLDERLARAYRTALSSPNAKAARASQRKWLETNRNSCDKGAFDGVTNCLHREYNERIFLLSALSTPRERILGRYTRSDPVCFVSGGPEGMECAGEIESSISVTESAAGLEVVMELFFFNGHQCNFEGTAQLQDGKLLVKGRPTASECTFEMYSDGERITSYVSDGMDEHCRNYCGARGSLNHATLEKNEN